MLDVGCWVLGEILKTRKHVNREPFSVNRLVQKHAHCKNENPRYREKTLYQNTLCVVGCSLYVTKTFRTREPRIREKTLYQNTLWVVGHSLYVLVTHNLPRTTYSGFKEGCRRLGVLISSLVCKSINQLERN